MVDTAFYSLREATKQIARQKDTMFTEQLEKWTRSRREVSSAISVANSLVTLPLIFVCLWWSDVQSLGTHLPGWMLTIMLFTAVILFCELLPKFIGLAQPVFILSTFWPLVASVHQLLGPLVRCILTWKDYLVAKLNGHPPMLPEDMLSLEELQALLEVTEEEGSFHREEVHLLRKIIKLSFMLANHCMIPRVDIFTLPDNLINAQAVISLLRGHRYRKVPVRGETPDEILGILDAQHFLLSPEEGTYTGRLRSASFVPETIQALELFVSFQTHRKDMAILLDEYGGIEGLVTSADLLEEMFGEEGSEQKNPPSIEGIEGGRFLVNGGLHLDDLGEVLGIDTSAFSAHTIGGLLIEHFGQLPEVGSSMRLENWVVHVQQTSRKRVLEVLISPLPTPQTTQTNAETSSSLTK